MKLYTNTSDSKQNPEQYALEQKRFAVGRLHAEVKNQPVLHTHKVCEIYYSISGGKQFFIDNNCYETLPGDVFVIAPGEQHRLTEQETPRYERFVIFVSLDFLQQLSTPQTDLMPIFGHHPKEFCHRLSLGAAQQSRLEFLLRKITSVSGFGSDLVENAAFTEVLTLLGGLYLQQEEARRINAPLQEEDVRQNVNPLAHQLLRYIDERITEPLTISQIAAAFYISDSYACRIFKEEYGTTINKYIQNRRLNIAKSLLAQGVSVTETCERSGFNDYTNFIKLFTRQVGISPKRYSVYGS